MERPAATTLPPPEPAAAFLPALEPGATGGPVPPTRAGLLWFLFGPVLCIVRPILAARLLVAAPAGIVITWAVVGLFVYSGVLVGLSLWNQTVVPDWSSMRLPVPPPTVTTHPTSVADDESADDSDGALGDSDQSAAPAEGETAGGEDEPAGTSATATPTTMTVTVTATPGGPWPWGNLPIRERTVAEVWTDWHADAIDGWVGVPAQITLFVIALGALAIAGLAWLNLPFVHRGGSPLASYARSLRIAAGGLWPLSILTGVAGIVYVSYLHAHHRIGRTSYYEPEFLVLWGVAISAILLILWFARALAATVPEPPATNPPPLCEGCGYDLRHQPESGRCPECGLAIAESLLESAGRPGHAGTASGLRYRMGIAQLFFWPSRFYRRIQLRSPASGLPSFVLGTYVSLGLGAAVWAAFSMALICVNHGGPPDEMWFAVVTAIASVILIGLAGLWLTHRTVAALVFTYWLTRRELPDYRWATRVIQYETVYLWVPCTYLALLIMSVIKYELWISELLGLSPFFPAGEFGTILLGFVGLTVLWIWRYQIAYRAIRWSNF